MASAFRAMKSHITESLDKVQSKSWAKPLGQTLAISGKILKGMGDFIPGANIIGGALSFGSSLLNPEPSMKDLQRELRDIKISLEDCSQSKGIIRALQTEEKVLQEKISNPQDEINTNFEEVKMELNLIFTKVGETNKFLTDEISKLKDIISKTYDLVADSRYKDGIEKVDAAYEVFIRDGFEDFQHFSFELKTIATMNLAPKRIEEYLTIIHERGGISMCQSVLEYVVVILGKYLQMMVAYSIFKEDQDKVTSHFKQFNQHYTDLGEVFMKVTSHDFTPGQKADLSRRPTAEVKPIPRGVKSVLEVSEASSLEVNTFLRKNGLSELKEIFSRSGVALQDVLEMDDQEMQEIGIKAYRIRKALHKAIREHQPNQLSQSEVPSRAFPTNAREHQPNQPSQSEVTSRAFPTIPGAPVSAAPRGIPPSSVNFLVKPEEKRKYDSQFDKLKPQDGKLSGDKVWNVMIGSKLPKSMLAKIWGLSDQDEDGFLDIYEFTVLMHLVDRALQGDMIPDQLPVELSQAKVPQPISITAREHQENLSEHAVDSYQPSQGMKMCPNDHFLQYKQNGTDWVCDGCKSGPYPGDHIVPMRYRCENCDYDLCDTCYVNNGELVNDDSGDNQTGDVENGMGTKKFPDGSFYSGEWKNGIRHGSGVYTMSNGMKYVGEFKDNAMNGHGTMMMPDAMKYVGEFTDNKFNGHGTITFADGGKYVGAFIDGYMNGQGTMTYPDGSEYVGEFKDDLPNGQGKMKYSDGTKWSGLWKDGEKQKSRWWKK